MAESVRLKDGRYIDTDGVYDFEQKKTQKEINARVHSINDSYSRQELINAKSDGTQTITIPKDGYIQCSVRCNATEGRPFIRLYIFNQIVYEGKAFQAQAYSYIWTPLFFVKKGTVVKAELETQSTNGERIMYLYDLA